MNNKYYFFDTETIGFMGDTMLIQYQVLSNSVNSVYKPVIHPIFESSVHSTLSLIEDMVESTVVGFNIPFDWYHIAQTYNILIAYLTEYGGEGIPEVDKYFLTKESLDPKDYLCLRPHRVFDLLMYGQESVLQGVLNQRPIYIRRVPLSIAEILITLFKKELDFPDVYFGGNLEAKNRWRIIRLTRDGEEVSPEKLSKFRDNPEDYPLDLDQDLCNLKLVFYPSASLKAIARSILGYSDVQGYDDSDNKGLTEYTYFPNGGNYKELFQRQMDKWSRPEELKYAEDDVLYTVETCALYIYLTTLCSDLSAFKDWSHEEKFSLLTEENLERLLSSTKTTNHELGVMVANIHLSGLSVNNEEVDRLYYEYLSKDGEYLSQVEYTKPRKCLEWIHEVADDIDKAIIKSTNKETLTYLCKDEDYEGTEVASRAQIISDARKNKKRIEILEKLRHSKRLHVTYKVLGTKSNRMAGSGFRGAPSINIQGIAKKGGLREAFTLKDEGFILGGGDFSSFEVAIMEAVYSDEGLRHDLLSGKSFHALVGAELYGMTYEQITAPENKDYYNKAKSYVFAKAYGAETQKLSEVTGVSPEQIIQADESFNRKYLGVKNARNRIQQDFTCLVQDPITKKVEWQEPKKYVESILGFKRHYNMEYMVIKKLHELSSSDLSNMDDGRYVVRKGREQTTVGAIRSALFSAAFSLMSQVLRASSNHVIQSVGGEMTKYLQERINNLQPRGIHPFIVKSINIHDETIVCMKPELKEQVLSVVGNFVEEYKTVVPLLAMDFNFGENWNDVH